MTAGPSIDLSGWLDALSPWLDEMDRVTDVCEGLGAPLK
jgi:hypothetical protein